MTQDLLTRRAGFRAMTEGTAEDWAVIAAHSAQQSSGLADRILGHLELLGGDSGGFAVDRLTHSLQTATRALRAGRSDTYVFCALVHDVGDVLAPHNHPDIAAAIVKPFVPADEHWMVEKHGVFQGYYFWHHLGGDRDARERYRDHPAFDLTAEFCERFDQCSFDPEYDTLPLAAFGDLVHAMVG
jgi:predicted HD phosphohydrolase